MSAATSKTNGKNGAKAPSDLKDPKTQLQEIQDLLFGQQFTEVNGSIETLSEHNRKQFAEMDKKIDQSIKDLKTYFTDQLNDLTKHVNKLNDASENRASIIEGDLDSLQQHVDTFEKQTHNAHDALESQLHSEAEKLAQDLERKYNEILEKLSKSSGELASEKIGREALAKLLVGVAHNLEGELS